MDRSEVVVGQWQSQIEMSVVGYFLVMIMYKGVGWRRTEGKRAKIDRWDCWLLGCIDINVTENGGKSWKKTKNQVYKEQNTGGWQMTQRSGALNSLGFKGGRMTR